jgi:hypothetical protein
MSRAQRGLLASAAAAALVVTGLTGSAAGDTSAKAPSPRGDRAVTQRLALAAGLQVGPKHTTRPTTKVGGKRYLAPNPYLSQLTSGSKPDYSYWRKQLATSKARSTARARLSAKVPTPVAVPEAEGAGKIGANDDQPRAERIANLGTSKAYQGATVQGRLSTVAYPTTAVRTIEDQGALQLATPTNVGVTRHSVTVSSRIGDGPHGSVRGGHGDFDFFKIRGIKGQSISATTKGSALDTVLVVYNSSGTIVAANDEADDTVSYSALDYDIPRTANYYVMVAGYSDFGTVPENPRHSGSGGGAGDEGPYKLKITGGPVDKDFYGVQLASGDVLGGSLTGSAITVGVQRVDGKAMIGSEDELSSIYPPQSPLPGGGSSFAYVAEQPGWYAVSVRKGVGPYKLLLETYRPGTAKTSPGAVQTIFLDFDGERMNTNIFGGGGVSTLSPLSSFLTRWGLSPADEPALIRAVSAGVAENISNSVKAHGLNPNLKVKVLNSLDSPDTFGQPNVSRVVVGGTIDETGIDTVGIAQSIDPGNYAHEESAMVLLDDLSAPAGPEDSLNTYVKAGRTNRLAFVAQALSNVISHETGHFVGSFHTDNEDATVDLMDAGGAGFDHLFGVGADQVGGTADDPDVDFGQDRYLPVEGLTGLENTLNVTAWAFLAGAGGPY